MTRSDLPFAFSTQVRRGSRRMHWTSPGTNSLGLAAFALLSACGGHGGGAGHFRSATLTVADASVVESERTLDFEVRLSAATDRAVRVHYRTQSGTALAGDDFEATEGTLTLGPGLVTATISVPVIADEHGEETETLTLLLEEPEGVRLEDPKSATGTLLDDDPPDAPDLEVESGGIRTLHLRWDPVPAAQHYQLYLDPDGTSQFRPIGDELPATTTRYDHELPVHLTDWPRARMVVEASNSFGSRRGEPRSLEERMIASIGYFKAPSPAFEDWFGQSVALSAAGDVLAVGVIGEDGSATGVDGTENELSEESGAVFVFRCTEGVWSQEAYIKASNTGFRDHFGWSLAMSADGETLAVGATGEDGGSTGVDGEQGDSEFTDSGAVYVFRHGADGWSQEAYLKTSTTGHGLQFGWSLALSSDGDTLAAGAIGDDSGATGIDGDEDDDSAMSSGAAYVFRREGNRWHQEAYVKASNTDRLDDFGYSLDLSGDGNLLAVGAITEDGGSSGVGGDEEDDSVRDSGATYLFRRVGRVWSQEAYLKASNTGKNDQFGFAVALSATGGTLVVGAVAEDSGSRGVDGDQDDDSSSESGAAYVFRYTAGVWSQEAYVKASNTGYESWFGNAIDLSADGDFLVVSALDDACGARGVGGDPFDFDEPGSGAVHVLRRINGSWVEDSFVKASNTGFGDELGQSLSLSADGNTLAVGAFGESGASPGIGGDQESDREHWSGAVYLY